MSINRHNYEEFFLLYVDNELTKEERLEVENFVRNNQDLAREFDALKESVLIPGNEIFLSKTNLYKETEGITLANCETYFLLHVDEELTKDEKYAVEKFVLQHPETQPNFTLLHQTKLEAEPVVFQNKELLYKQEDRKVIWMNWSRIAIAAMFAGVAIALYFLIPSGHVQQLQPGTEQTAVNTTNNLPGGAKTGEDVKNNVPGITPKTAPSTVAIVAVKTPSIPIKTRRRVEQSVINTIERTNQQDATIATLTSPHPVEVTVTEKSINPANKNLATEITQLASNKVNMNNKQDGEETKDLVQQTVYREIDTDADERENSFLLGSARINKNKLRGLLKKASGLFDKKADKAENEKTIQIASFEIKGK